MDLLILVAVLSTSLVLVASGVEHAAGQARFRSRLADHHVLGFRGVRSVGAALPVLELMVAAGAFWAVATSSRTGLVTALLVQTVLYLSFAGYLALVVKAGNAGVPCGCGPAEVPVGRSAIARAVGLGALSGASAVVIGAYALGPIHLRADVRGLLAGAAGFTLAVLLVILAPARRLEPLTTTQSGLPAGDPASPGTTPERTMIGSA